MISVVIPALNEEANIGKCLEALVAQDNAEPMDIIVVDNGSTDRTMAVALSYADRLPGLRVLSEPRRGRGMARSRGFSEAKGDPIFSLDADTFVPPTWISVYVETLRSDPEIIAVTGVPKITDCDPVRNAFLTAYIPIQMHAYRMLFGHFWLSGFSFAIKRAAYDAVGGFNPQTDAYEDMDLSFRIHRTKLGRICLEPEPRVIFSGRRFKRGIVRGGMDYIATFTVKFLLRKERVILQIVDNDGRPVDNEGSIRLLLTGMVTNGMKDVGGRAKRTVARPVLTGVRLGTKGMRVVRSAVAKRIPRRKRQVRS